MNNLDALFLIITIYLVFKGYKKGFVGSLRFFLSVLGGGFLSYTFSESFLSFLHPSPISNPTLARFLLFLLFFIFCNIIAHFLSQWIAKGFEKISLLWLDKGLGALFGAFKSLALMFLFVSLSASFQITPFKSSLANSSFVKHSYFMAKSMTGINLIEKFKETAQKTNLPSSFQEKF